MGYSSDCSAREEISRPHAARLGYCKGKQRPRAALGLVTQAARTPYSVVVVEAGPSAKYEIEEKRKDIVPPPAPLAENWVLISVVHRLYYVSFLFPKWPCR